MTDKEIEKLKRDNAVQILDMLSKEASDIRADPRVFLNSLFSILGMWNNKSCHTCKGGDVISPIRPYEVLVMCNYCKEE